MRTAAEAPLLAWTSRVAWTLAGGVLMAGAVWAVWRFWEEIPAGVRVALLVAAPLAGLAATEFAGRRERGRWFTTLLALAALAALVADLEGLRVWFNIPPEPLLLVAWGTFALLLAYRHGLPIVLITAQGLMVAAGVAILGGTDLVWGWSERPEISGALGLGLFVLPRLIRQRQYLDFAVAYRVAGGTEVLLSLLRLVAAGHITLLPYQHRTVALLYLAVSMLLAFAALWFGLKRGRDEVADLGWILAVLAPCAWAGWMHRSWPVWLGLPAAYIALQLVRSRLRRDEDRAEPRAVAAGRPRWCPPALAKLGLRTRLAGMLALGSVGAWSVQGLWFSPLAPWLLTLGILMVFMAAVLVGTAWRWAEVVDAGTAMVALACIQGFLAHFLFEDHGRLALWGGLALLLFGLQRWRVRVSREVAS